MVSACCTVSCHEDVTSTMSVGNAVELQVTSSVRVAAADDAVNFDRLTYVTQLKTKPEINSDKISSKALNKSILKW